MLHTHRIALSLVMTIGMSIGTSVAPSAGVSAERCVETFLIAQADQQPRTPRRGRDARDAASPDQRALERKRDLERRIEALERRYEMESRDADAPQPSSTPTSFRPR